jgi:branched-chain amino acid transport system permease protein
VILASTLPAIALFSGVGVGAIYGLIGLGYAVVYSGTGVFNLAQGDLLMIGTLLSYYFISVLGWGSASVILVVICVIGISLVEERIAVRPFLRQLHGVGWFVATVAFSLVLETVATIVYGDRPAEQVPGPFGNRTVAIGSIHVNPQYFLALGVLVAMVVMIAAFYRYSWFGQAMRASAEDREAASLRGIRPSRVSMAAFAIGGLIAGIGGYLVGPITFANPSIGLNYTLKGFLAIAIGGFGSLPGVIIGGLVLGIGEQYFDLYVNARFEDLVGLVLLFLVLMVKPRGLFGVAAERAV